MRPRATWLLTPLPFAALAYALLDLPISRLRAVGNAALLFVLMVAHAACYARWQPRAPNRILVNELLARLWFAVYAILIAGLLGGNMLAAALGLPLAFASWQVHRARLNGTYHVVDNVVQLGIYLALLAVVLGLAV